METVSVATPEELGDVLKLLNEAADWLHARGIEQWPYGFGPQRIEPLLNQRKVYLARSADEPVATFTASTAGDTDFWTDEELAQPAVYLRKLAVSRAHAGLGLGALLICWIADQAAGTGARLIRLDAWRANRRLHQYYERNGWTCLRTVHSPSRSSGTLFQMRALPNPLARRAFDLIGHDGTVFPGQARGVKRDLTTSCRELLAA